MGKDKHENEDLIKYGLPEDVWFHVSALSSAHVYLRQKPGEKLDDISPQLLLECAALVKVRNKAYIYMPGCINFYWPPLLGWSLLDLTATHTYAFLPRIPYLGQLYRRMQAERSGSGIYSVAEFEESQVHGSGADWVPWWEQGKVRIKSLPTSPLPIFFWQWWIKFTVYRNSACLHTHKHKCRHRYPVG